MPFSRVLPLSAAFGLFFACGNPGAEDEETAPSSNNDYETTTSGAATSDAATTIDEPTGPKISYALDIEPLFIVNCAICHFDGGTAVGTADSDLDLTEGNGYSALTTKSSVATGSKFIGPTLEQSYLWAKMEGTKPPAGTTMPFGTVLLGSELTLVKQWIEGGAAP